MDVRTLDDGEKTGVTILEIHKLHRQRKLIRFQMDRRTVYKLNYLEIRHVSDKYFTWRVEHVT
jgi:hypothetical protein